MNTISDLNVPNVYCEAFWKMRVWAEEDTSRNGPVMKCKDVFLEIYRPNERVLFDRERNANPFFHMMEFIWMMAGHNDSHWIGQFNQRMYSYAEPSGVIHGAYGHRWREHFGIDQITECIQLLKDYPDTRRAVLGMWDPEEDANASKADLPCNTHIYVTLEKEGLEFTVCNRSNDLVWGMLGTNVVHMTMLQEIMADSLDVGMSSYKVFTKNLHVYKNLPNFDKIWNTMAPNDLYANGAVRSFPILCGQRIENFFDDCEAFIRGLQVSNHWLNRTARPMRDAYIERLSGGTGLDEIGHIEATDWKAAAALYVELKGLSSAKAEGV
jgi:thymidylate synthase